jgi:hypothetical protein
MIDMGHISTDDQARGACDGMSLQLSGPFTGYHNEPTMQVGLWIANDGALFNQARRVASINGPRELARWLGVRMPSAVSYVVSARDLAEIIDWAQIAYDLIGEDYEPSVRERLALGLRGPLGRTR